MDIASRNYAENPIRNPYMFVFPAGLTRPAGIVLSIRHLSLGHKVWQRTVAHGSCG